MCRKSMHVNQRMLSMMPSDWLSRTFCQAGYKTFIQSIRTDYIFVCTSVHILLALLSYLCVQWFRVNYSILLAVLYSKDMCVTYKYTQIECELIHWFLGRIASRRYSRLLLMFHGLFVNHACEPYKIGWTHQVAIWYLDSGGPREPCGVWIPFEKGNFARHLLAHCKV